MVRSVAVLSLLLMALVLHLVMVEQRSLRCGGVVRDGHISSHHRSAAASSTQSILRVLLVEVHLLLVHQRGCHGHKGRVDGVVSDQ